LRILVLDPATTTGYAIGDIEADKPNSHGFVKLVGTTREHRLCTFESWLEGIIKRESMAKTPIDLIAYERPGGSHFTGVQFHANLEGLILLVAHKNELKLLPLSAKSMKKFVTGSGNATKADVLKSIKTYTPNIIDDNEGDAYGFFLLAKNKLQND
jgi:Holliday junction resolvasome RuvABC endonuclease subunit